MKKLSLPPIGNRIIKSALGVLICFCVYFLRGREGIPFYSMLAVLWCIQPYTDRTLKMAAQRITGTLTGAMFGLITIVLEIYVVPIYNTLLGYAVVALMIIPVIYSTVLMNRKNASYFSCVVFLSITVMHITDSNPFIFVMNRVLDTFIGIAVGVVINSLHLPRRHIKDTLFAADLDVILPPESEELTPYSRVEINRMLKDGLKFTVMTMRTPAAVTEILGDIKLNLPVIVMNGSALYDTMNNSYVKVFPVPNESCAEIRGIAKAYGVNIFTNALCDDTLIIYYDSLNNEAERSIYNTLKKSPLRNYINRLPREGDRIIYFMMIDKSEKISAVYNAVSAKLCKKLKIITYPSVDYPGYSYIKIYNKNSGKQNMIDILCREYDIEKCVTVGKLAVNNGDSLKGLNKVTHELKNKFEPTVFTKT